MDYTTPCSMKATMDTVCQENLREPPGKHYCKSVQRRKEEDTQCGVNMERKRRELVNAG